MDSSTRHPFGGSIADYVFEAAVGGVVSVSPGAALTFWAAQSGGSQYTDLSEDVDGLTPITSVLSEDGSDPAYAAGDIAVLYGPPGIVQMWASADGGPRKLMTAMDLAPVAADAVTRDLVTAKGDLLAASGPGVVDNLAVGTNGQVLIADNTTALGLRWGAGGGGGASLPNTKIVAAVGSGVTGDYTCDGVADQVQLQAAYDAVKAAGGGTVLLTAGEYTLSATWTMNGSADPDTSVMVRIQGAGNYSTRLVGASGINLITISQIARVHIADLGFEMAGAADGIKMVTVNDGTYWRSSDECVLERLYFTGGYSGHTGWAMNLGSIFRSSVRDIHIEGVKGGIRMAAEYAQQNPGDCTFDRMMVGISENNGVAYQIESPTSSMNQMLFMTCHSFAEPGNTNTVSWKLSGAFGSNHIKVMNCNSEQFGKLVEMSAGFDADMRFVHVTAKNGSTMFDLGADTYANRFEVGELYVESGATMTLINDLGSAAPAKPNRYMLPNCYVETGATVNATMGYAFLEAGAFGGSGTVAAVLKRPLQGWASRAIPLTDGATITIDAARSSYHRVTLAGNRTLAAPLNPSDGQRLVIEVVQDATGTRTLTWNAAFAFSTTYTNALTTTAAKRDIFEFIYNLTTSKWQAITASKNI